MHIRPPFFAEWLVFPWVRDKIRRDGEIALPFGNGRHAPISAEDQARFIAAVLANPSGHTGQNYELCGPVQMNQAEIAGVMSDAMCSDARSSISLRRSTVIPSICTTKVCRNS